MQTHLDIVFYQVCCKMSTDMLQLARFWLFKANRIDMSLITRGGGVHGARAGMVQGRPRWEISIFRYFTVESTCLIVLNYSPGASCI